MATIDENSNSISKLLNSTDKSIIESNPTGSSTSSPSLGTNLNGSVASPSLMTTLPTDNNTKQAPEKLQSMDAYNIEEQKDRRTEIEGQEIKPFPEMKTSIKYSVEQLLALSKSPLVKCPNTFPDITTWIGDTYYETNHRERESEIERKKPFNTTGDDRKADRHNEENSHKPGEKNIVLGPPKMSFASSQKQTMANTKSSERVTATRNSKNNYNLPRHLVNGRSGRNDDSRNDQNGKRSSTNVDRDRNYSKERENGSNRKGLRETREDFEKHSSRENQGGRNRNNQGSGQTRKAGGKDGSIADRNKHFQHLLEKKLDIGGDHHRNNGKQGTPEWMTYDPDAEKSEKQLSNSYSATDESGYIDEIQAWKHRVNEQNSKKSQLNLDLTRDKPQHQHNMKEGLLASWGNMKTPASNSNLVQQNSMDTVTDAVFEDVNSKRDPAQSNVDYLFGPGGLNFKDEKESMKPFLHNNHDTPEIKPNLARESVPVNNERDAAQSSSRFFRLFQKDNLTEDSYFESNKSQDSVMLNRILMGSQTGQVQDIPAPTSALTSSTQTDKRMLSEADVLKTLGVTNTNLKQNHQAPKAQSVNSTSHVPRQMLTEEDILNHLKGKPPQQQQFRSIPGQQSESNVSSEIPRMASEADVLKTLGVNMHSKTTVSQDNLEDKTGFDMIMARLNKATNDSLDTNGDKPSLLDISKSKGSSSPGTFSDPSITTTKKPEPSTPGNNMTSAASSKSIAALFGGNIPTSVYRQMSGKHENGTGTYSPVEKSSSFNAPFVSISPNPASQFQPQTIRPQYTTTAMTSSGNSLESMLASSPMVPSQSPSSGIPFEKSPNIAGLSSPNNNLNINQSPLYRSDPLTHYNVGGTQRPAVFFDQLLNNGHQHHPMLQQQHHSNLPQQSPRHDQFLAHLQPNSYMIPPTSSLYSSRDQFGMSGREPPLPHNMGGFPMRPPTYMGGQPPHPYDSARRPVQNTMSGRMLTVEEIERLSMR